MLKSISNLGTVLNKKEQMSIQGGTDCAAKYKLCVRFLGGPDNEIGSPEHENVINCLRFHGC